MECSRLYVVSLSRHVMTKSLYCVWMISSSTLSTDYIHRKCVCQTLKCLLKWEKLFLWYVFGVVVFCTVRASLGDWQWIWVKAVETKAGWARWCEVRGWQLLFTLCLSLLCALSLSLYFHMHFLFFLIVVCSLILMLSELRLTLAGRWDSLGEESLQCQAVSILLSCSGLNLTVVADWHTVGGMIVI